MKNILRNFVSCYRESKITSRFYIETKAVAAVEFALIAPLLLVLFLGTVETSLFISIDRKLSRTSSAIADLITQAEDDEVPDAEIRSIIGIADKIMFPYEDSIPCIVISAIEVELDDTNNNGVQDGAEELVARVRESVDNSTGSSEYSDPTSTCDPHDITKPEKLARQLRTVNTIFPIPEGLKTEGSFLIVVEVELDHFPIVGVPSLTNLTNFDLESSKFTMGDRIFLRPREVSEIDFLP